MANRKVRVAKGSVNKPGKNPNGPNYLVRIFNWVMTMKKGWDYSKDLFDYRKITSTIGQAIDYGTIKKAAWMIFFAAIITVIIAFATTLLSVHLVNFASDTLSEASGVPQPTLTFDKVLPVLLFQIVLYIPISIAIALIYEGVFFVLAKITGGKGAFEKQIYMSSVIGLSIAMTSGLSLFAPLPCLQVIAAASLIVLTFYFMFFVSAKAYAQVHQIGGWHSFIMVLVLSIIRLAVLLLITNWLAVTFGLPPVIDPGVANV